MEENSFFNHIHLEKPLAEAKTLAEADVKAAKSDSGFLAGVLTKYYRQSLTFDLDVYRNLDQQPVETRQAVQKDPFWNRIGRFVHVLDFSEAERIKFAAESEVEKIAVFLLFEKDLDVLERVFNNPSLPTKALMDYINVIKERDIDREDDKILRLAQRTFRRRSRRIIKARDILNLGRDELTKESLQRVLSYVADDDPQIRGAALNAIALASPDLFADILKDDSCVLLIRQNNPEISGAQTMDVLYKSIRHILRIYDTRALMESEKQEHGAGSGPNLLHLYEQLKQKELGRCTDDPTDFFNLSILAYLQLDPDEEIRATAGQILSAEDILELASDESTPRPIGNEILTLFGKHPEVRIQEIITEVRLREAERVNRRMKELEVSVNAYFDVVFQSLGYSRINDQKEAVEMLRGALTYVQQFASGQNTTDPATATVAQGFMRQAIEYYESSIDKLYSDTKKELFQELDEIQGITRHILDLKNFKFEEEDEKQREAVDEAILNKAVMIWRSSISQYLGRIKDLEEMLRIKWTRLVAEQEPGKKPETIESELYEAFDEIEAHHKEDVDCKLKIPCRECKRRGCASERFLLQTEFLLAEISDNFHKAKSSAHG